MSGQPIFSNATLDDTDVNKPVFSSIEAKKLSDYSPTYSAIAINGGKIEVTFDEDLATISSFDANSFVIKDSGTTYTVNEVTIANKKVTIGTNHTHTSSNNLTVEYTKPADLTKAIKTSNGIVLDELKIVDNVNRSGEFPKPTTVVANDYDGGKKELEVTFNELVEGSISSDDFVVTTTSDNTVHQPLIVNVTNDKVVLRKGTITRKGLVDGTMTGADSSWSDGTRAYTSSSNHGGYYPYKAFEDALGTNIWHSTNKYSSGNASASAGDTYLQDISTTTTYQVTKFYSTAYKFNGGEYTNYNNPSLTLLRGKTYEFVVNASGHPFRINTTNTKGTGSEYSSGVTNNGTDSGTVTFTVPSDAPNTLYYNCEHHSNMSGTITVIDPTNYKGEWLQVDLGSSTSIGNFEILPREFDQFQPKDFKLFGKVNETDNWTEIYEVTGLTAADWKTGTTHHSAGNWDVNFTGRYFRLVINKVVTGSYACVGELILNNINYLTMPSDVNTLTINYSKNTNASQNLKVKGTTTSLDSFLYRNGNHIKSFTFDSPVRPSAVDLINNDGTSHIQNRGDLNKIIDNNDSSLSYVTLAYTTGSHGPFILSFDFPTSLVGKSLSSIKWKWGDSEGTLNAKFGIRSGSTNTSLNVSGVSNIGTGTFNGGIVSTWNNDTDWHIDTAVANDNATVLFNSEYTIQSGDTFLFRWLNSNNNKHLPIYNIFFITENPLGAPSIVDTTVVTFNKVISASDSYSKNDFTIKQGTTALSIKEINISNDGKLLITTNESVTDANILDIVYKKNVNVANHLKDNNNKKINSFRIKNTVDIKPIIFSFNQNIALNQNVDKNDFILSVDGVVKSIHDVLVMEEGKLLIRPEESITDINKTMIKYTKSATSNKNIANANGDSVLTFTYHNIKVSKKSEGSNEILQVSGALPESTNGGTASPQKRTIYIYDSDTNTTPSYTGANRPFVKVSDYKNLIVDPNINATITIANNILLVNGKPAYQYVNDVDENAAGGDTLNLFYFFTSTGQSKKVLDNIESAASSSGIQANDINLVKNKRINSDGETIALSLNQPLQNIADKVEKRAKRHAVLKLLFSSNPLRKQFKIEKQELALDTKITKSKVMVIKSGETINLSNNSPIDENTGVYANLTEVNDAVVFNTGASNITFTRLANNNYSVSGYNNSTIITRSGQGTNWTDGDSSTFDGITYYFGGVSTNGTDDTPGEDFVATTVTVSTEKDGSSGLLNHLNRRTGSMNSNTTQKEIKKHKRNFSSSDYLLYKKLRHFKK